MKTKLLSMSVMAFALGAAWNAQAASTTIFFDPDGAGPGGAVAVDSFDWLPDNGLGVGTFSNPFNPDGSKTFQLVSQGKLGSLVGPGNTPIPISAGEFTFQASMFETVVGIGTPNTGGILGPGPSSVTMYYNAVTGVANQVTGGGYSAGIPILTGTVTKLSGAFVDFTSLLPIAFPVTNLDSHGADNQNGTRTRQGNGSTTVSVAVNWYDPNFFTSFLPTMIISLGDTTNSAVPFITADPSNTIVGFTPYYSLNGAGQRVNGENVAGMCVGGGQDENGNSSSRCDLHLQTDASSSFSVPEPGSVALLGLSLAGLGFYRRQRKLV